MFFPVADVLGFKISAKTFGKIRKMCRMTEAQLMVCFLVHGSVQPTHGVGVIAFLALMLPWCKL